QTPVLREIDKSLQIKGVVALGGIARTNVIDLVRSDFGQRDQRRDAQDRRGDEYGAVRQVCSEPTHERSGHSISGAGEAVISPNATRHSMTAGETETDRSDRCSNDARGHAMQNLSHEYEREARPERENECRGSNQDQNRMPPAPASNARRPAPPRRGAGGRPAGFSRPHPRQSADREREPNVLFRPTQIGQVESEERAEAHLDIGQEKVRPIETPPATVPGAFACGDAPR